MSEERRNGIKIGSKKVLEQITRNKSSIEGPATILGVEWFDVTSFGAFSFCRGGWIGGQSSIGRFCSIAPGVTIGPTEHKTSLLTTSTFLNSSSWESAEAKDYCDRNRANIERALTKMREPETRNQKRVTIGNDVWIGQGALVRKGVSVGDGAVVGANSVVSRDVAPYEIVSGVPAQTMRYRFDKETIENLCHARWWDFSLNSLDGIDWSDPVSASYELRRRRESGTFELANYPRLGE